MADIVSKIDFFHIENTNNFEIPFPAQKHVNCVWQQIYWLIYRFRDMANETCMQFMLHRGVHIAIILVHD